MDRSIVLALLAAALFFVLHPDSANRLAAVMGVGRGADLFFDVAIPGLLALCALLLFSRIRELEQQTTVLIRELAILRAERADEAPTASIAEP